MNDTFTPYEIGLERLLAQLGRDHLRYTDALVYQHRLQENVSQARKYGDTEARRAERAQIVDLLNQLALETTQISFNELCRLAAEPPDTKLTEMVSVAPLGTELPVEEPPPHLNVLPGHRYLGKLDGLPVDHLYRELDGHVALWVPALPGIPAFLIDKYAITAHQFSLFLNDLIRQGLARIDRPLPGDVTSCIDVAGHPVAFDALDRWKRTSSPQKPSSPWGLTYHAGAWQPVAGCELLPAALVTWWGAQLYSLWAHRQPIDVTNDRPAYLPTVQQWQTAALFDPVTKRGRLYPWGETWERSLVNYTGYWAGREVRGQAGWERYWTNQPDVVKSTRPLPVSALSDGCSPIGCVQLIGNIWEWSADASSDDLAQRIVKGGACNSPQEYWLRSVEQSPAPPPLQNWT